MRRMIPKLHSYTVARDYGFAPNPFHGFCTLATCKPVIRKSAAIGDWIAGTDSTTEGRVGRLVYAMCVSETLSFDQYWNDPRFVEKRPFMYGSMQSAFGDNIYSLDSITNEWRQIDSHHSYEDGFPNHNNVCRDTKADRVLISEDFVYWGGNGPEVPSFRGHNLRCRRGHKSSFPPEVVGEFISWIRGLEQSGYCGVPTEWV